MRSNALVMKCTLAFALQWQATLSSLIKSDSSEAGAKTGGVARLYELGPGQQIKAMVRRMDRDVWNTLTNVAP
jgi:hypothetical protein